MSVDLTLQKKSLSKFLRMKAHDSRWKSGSAQRLQNATNGKWVKEIHNTIISFPNSFKKHLTI